MSVEEDPEVEGGTSEMITCIVLIWMAYHLNAPWWIYVLLVISGIAKCITITSKEDD